MTTTFPAVKDLDKRWLLIDAEGQILGRLASRIAVLLRGKHKPTYTPFLDTGDYVVVVNARKIMVTGQKLDQKVYRTYSGYPHGLRQRTLREQLERHPDRVVRQAVKGMLPDGPLGRRVLGNLKVYADATHPHQAQRPEPMNASHAVAPHGHA